MTEVPRFGERPLPQTIAAAGALRRLAGLLLTVEHPHPTVDAMLTRFAEWEAELAEVAPSGPPRMAGAEAGRVYLDHAFDIGAYNPCFPEYCFDQIGDSPDLATGTVTFPVVYEGPPGLVHGGFLGVFLDCAVQHHNCATGRAGKTRSLSVRYRRPVPLLVELRLEIARIIDERGLTSTATLLLADEVLCVGTVDTLALTPGGLAGAHLDTRHPMPTDEELHP